MDTEYSVVMARGKRGWGMGKSRQRGGNGDICNNVNNKKKKRVQVLSVYTFIITSKRHVLHLAHVMENRPDIFSSMCKTLDSDYLPQNDP